MDEVAVFEGALLSDEDLSPPQPGKESTTARAIIDKRTAAFFIPVATSEIPPVRDSITSSGRYVSIENPDNVGCDRGIF